MKTSEYNCVISGSFNRFFSEMKDFYEDLIYYKFHILSPNGFEISDDSTEFIRLKGDVGTTIGEIEAQHLESIKKSQFLIVFNPKNYVGISTALEIGYAIENKKNIFFSNNLPKFLKNEVKRSYPLFSFNNNIELLYELLKKTCSATKLTSPKANFPFKMGNILVLDNSTKEISVTLAFYIGKLIAQQSLIFCTKRPKDILLKEVLNTISGNKKHISYLEKLNEIYISNPINNYFKKTLDISNPL